MSGILPRVHTGVPGAGVVTAVACVLSVLAAVVTSATWSPAAAAPTTRERIDALAGTCVSLHLPDGRPLGDASAPFSVRAAGGGRFLFYGRDARLLTATPSDPPTLVRTPTIPAIWSVRPATP